MSALHVPYTMAIVWIIFTTSILESINASLNARYANCEFLSIISFGIFSRSIISSPRLYFNLIILLHLALLNHVYFYIFNYFTSLFSNRTNCTYPYNCSFMFFHLKKPHLDLYNFQKYNILYCLLTLLPYLIFLLDILFFLKKLHLSLLL